jgi:1-acyl-sn-glycerol-3-phosphate acyltransferase
MSTKNVFLDSMISLLRKAHLIYFMALLLLLFLVFLPFYYFFSRNEKYYNWLNKSRTLHSSLVALLSGIAIKFDFEEPLEASQTYIFCSNHTSNLDILIFCLLAKGRYHFMGKEELLKNPILGIFFKTIDITVARESKISAFRAFKKAADNLEKGMSLIIFPEGKIDDAYPPILQDFKSGPFRLAIEKEIPMVPVTIINAWEIMFDDGWKHGSCPGIINVHVHKPILTSILAIENDDALKAEVHEKINSKL